jgi:glutamate-1-semialdehyde 2,1-aminomutase
VVACALRQRARGALRVGGLVQNVLAKKVIEAVPSVEMVRFCNSGTEACMGALRLMRAYTGRPQILKFEGCYHGHADPFLVQAGSGVATLGLPDSPGVPKGATAGTLCAPYNDLAAVKKIFEENPESIAGIILEPVRARASFGSSCPHNAQRITGAHVADSMRSMSAGRG